LLIKKTLPKMPKINKRENELKGAYWQRFDVLTKPGTFFRMNVQDVRTSGYADSQLLGNKIASFWEFKHATPNFKTYGLQEITAQMVDLHTYCRYVLFVEFDGHMATWIVHPDNVRNSAGILTRIEPEYKVSGHDFDWLADFMKKVHRP
jgi:hypothetical protein